jgi:hypothetical protein
MRLIGLLAAALVACVSGAAGADDGALVGTAGRSLTVSPSPTIAIDVRDAGKHSSVDVHVTGWGRSDVRIDQLIDSGDASKVRTDIRRDGGTLRLRTEFTGSARSWVEWFGNTLGPKIRLDLHVPAGSRLDIDSANGGIAIDNVYGPIRAGAGNGGIRASGAGPSLQLETTNGGIDATIAKLGAPPAIVLRATNGGIRLTVPRGFSTRVQASTVNGGIANPFADAKGPGSAAVSTTNGGISIHQ